MKKIIYPAAAALCFSLLSTFAQPGGPRGVPGGDRPAIDARMAKLFGDNPAFTATLENKSTRANKDETIMPGKMAFDSGKSRFEMDLSEAKAANLTPDTVAQMKSMGMDKMIMISRPDKKVNYLVYPGFNAYVETAMKDPDASKPDSAFKIKTTELGKETVDGHPCVKNKVVVTDDDGTDHESIVYNATDLKNFPVRVETSDRGSLTTLTFKDVKFSKPNAALFDPPADATKYDDFSALIQREMMKRMGGGMPGMTPGR